MTPAEKLAASNPRIVAAAKRYRPLVWAVTLRDRRKSLGLSTNAVANAVGISAGCYHWIERGTDPMLINARRLADFFGATVEDLWPALLPPTPKE